MPQWNAESGYSGPLLDLLDELLENYHPKVCQLIRADEWIRRQIDLECGPIPFRHISTIRERISRPGPPKPRYYYKADGLPFDAIATDNEATSSVYHEVLSDRLDSRQSILEACQSFLCVGIKRKSTPSPEAETFKRYGIKTGMYKGADRMACKGLKLCHIHDAAKSLPGASIREQLKLGAYRTLCPINVVPFPLSNSGSKFRYSHRINGEVVGDLGECPSVLLAFEARLHDRFKAAGHEPEFRRRLKRVRNECAPRQRIEQYSSMIDQFMAAHLEIVPREDRHPQDHHSSAAIARKASDEPMLPAARKDSDSDVGSTTEIVRVFEVKETSAGRFHLSGFGVKCGGTDRNDSFVFVVRDRYGREVARSLKVTCRQLLIAERSRGDYDANRFSRTDFFKRDAGGRPIPYATIARRCRWTFRRRKT